MASAAEHFAKADALMQRVSDMDAGLAIARNLTAQAHVHALLAMYVPPPDHEYRDGFSGPARQRRARQEFL